VNYANFVFLDCRPITDGLEPRVKDLILNTALRANVTCLERREVFTMLNPCMPSITETVYRLYPTIKRRFSLYVCTPHMTTRPVNDPGTDLKVYAKVWNRTVYNADIPVKPFSPSYQWLAVPGTTLNEIRVLLTPKGLQRCAADKLWAVLCDRVD